MNGTEKNEINSLPPEYRPLGAWTYFGLNILFSIPIIGQIFLIVFCFSGSNINRRSYARSFFCGFIIALIVALIIFFIVGGTAGITALIAKFNSVSLSGARIALPIM